MSYLPERYWETRYSDPDLRRSGHQDLPERYNRWLYRRKQTVLRAALARAGFTVTGKRVLEVGAGLGAYVEFWTRLQVTDLTGLDISAAAVDYVRRRHPQVRILKRDVTEPDLRRDTGDEFDLTTALDVLYHVVDEVRFEAALANIAAVTRRGGLLALHDQFLHRPGEDHGYIRWRSLADWQSSLARAGFEIVSRTPIFFSMVQPNDCRTPRGMARMDAWWRHVNPWIQRLPGPAGALLYALDTAIAMRCAEGPSMELMLARRTR
jgi:SAM-dependent methyltransferase